MTYKKIAKKYTPSEIAESYLPPADQKDREAVLNEFKAFREKVKGRQTEKSKMTSDLLQLKYMMDDYLNQEHTDPSFGFSFFLKEYMVRLHKNGKELAADINVDPAEVSNVVNNKRKPTERFIYRLDIHSNRSFPASVWLRILEKERITQIMNDKKMFEEEKRQVIRKITITI